MDPERRRRADLRVGRFGGHAVGRLKNGVLRRPIGPSLLAQGLGMPRRRQVIWRQRVLRRPRERQWSGFSGRAIRGSGTMRPKTLVEIFVQHLGSSLRALADRNRCLRSDGARVVLPVAE